MYDASPTPNDSPQATTPITDLLANGVGLAGVDRVLRTVRKYLGMDVAFIAHFRERDRVFEFVDAEQPAPLDRGAVLPLEQGYCAKVARGELPQLITDAARLPAAAAIPETRTIPIGAHLSVPIVLDNGELYGTLCCFSYEPDLTLGERDMRMMRAFAEVLATRISETQAAEKRNLQRAGQIRNAIAAGAPRIVFQPIIRLQGGDIAGFECLSRFDLEPRQTPDRWFAAAHEVGVGDELELAAIHNAVASIGQFSSKGFFGINSSPGLISSGKLQAALPGSDLSRLVLEITEHAMVDDYGFLNDALAPLRERNLRIAIDDAGAGYASMRHIVNLKPDIIKLDMSLTRDIDRDAGRRALAKALISFGKDVGSILCAEGVETRGELEMLRSLGVEKAQGYYLSKPLSLADAVRAQAGETVGASA